MRIILSISILFISSICLSQNTFRHTFGGIGDDYGQDIEQTSDGGYIITGSTGSFGYGQSDVYLLKIDIYGDYVWSRSYGGHNVDWGYDVDITPDNGFIITGYTNSFGEGGYDFYLIRTDSVGDTLWTRTYGGWNWDLAYSSEITHDYGYVIVGETYSYGAGEKDIWIIKTDEFGDTLWTKTIGGSLDDIAYKVIEAIDSSLIIVGKSETFSDDGFDGIIISLDKDGNEIYISNTGGSFDQEFKSVIQQNDTSGFVCFGTSSSSSSSSDMYMAMFDNNGVFAWDKTMGNGNVNTGSSINKRVGNSLIVVGTNDNDENDIEALVTSSSGAIWAGDPHIGGYLKDEGTDIILTSDNIFAILGNTTSFGQGYSDVLVYKSVSSIPTDSSNYVNIADTNTIFHPNPISAISDRENSDEFSIFPNPASSPNFIVESNQFIDELALIDQLGRVVLQLNNIGNKAVISTNDIDAGIYLVRVRSDDEIYSQKVIVNQ